MGLVYNTSIVMDGLVVYLDAANTKSYPGTGTTWIDLSGNANNGTLSGGPIFNAGFGGSIVFDGSNDEVTGVNNSQVNIVEDMTIESWFMVTGARGDWVRLFGKGNATNRTYGLWYRTDTNVVLYQRYGTNAFTLSSTQTLSLNTWYHLAATSIGSTHKLYFNGSLINTTTAAPTFESTTSLYRIGYGESGIYHLGRIGNCKLYNRGLSDSEILQNFNALRGRYGI